MYQVVKQPSATRIFAVLVSPRVLHRVPLVFEQFHPIHRGLVQLRARPPRNAKSFVFGVVRRVAVIIVAVEFIDRFGREVVAVRLEVATGYEVAGLLTNTAAVVVEMDVLELDVLPTLDQVQKFTAYFRGQDADAFAACRGWQVVRGRDPIKRRFHDCPGVASLTFSIPVKSGCAVAGMDYRRAQAEAQLDRDDAN